MCWGGVLSGAGIQPPRKKPGPDRRQSHPRRSRPTGRVPRILPAIPGSAPARIILTRPTTIMPGLATAPLDPAECPLFTSASHCAVRFVLVCATVDVKSGGRAASPGRKSSSTCRLTCGRGHRTRPCPVRCRCCPVLAATVDTAPLRAPSVPGPRRKRRSAPGCADLRPVPIGRRGLCHSALAQGVRLIGRVGAAPRGQASAASPPNWAPRPGGSTRCGSNCAGDGGGDRLGAHGRRGG